jgi:glutamate-ammonia-ligase adenylyltransferase
VSPHEELQRLAAFIDAPRAALLRAELEAEPLSLLLATAFPPLTPHSGWQVDALAELGREGLENERHRRELLTRFEHARLEPDPEARLVALRRVVWAEKARIALRELLPVELGGGEIETTARELSLLAEISLELALWFAELETADKFGAPVRADGAPSELVVLGMGKLGGLELNAGSDIDLVFVYDTDEGQSSISLHEHWTRVARRLVEILEEPSPDGMLFRVDLRLRPEGSQGPIANSFDATERYYTTWGRLWERAALIRARPAAGSRALGALLEREVFAPFVYRREVDLSLARGLAEIVTRTRAELSSAPERDLKLGKGGIREAEFFVQTLQLVWGGQEPSLRVTNTLQALGRLESRGLVTAREARVIADAYALLRKLEHRVQWSTGIQTHLLPPSDEGMARLARTLRLEHAETLQRELSRLRSSVHALFRSLAPGAVEKSSSRFQAVAAELGASEGELFGVAAREFGDDDIALHLVALARRPDGLLGDVTRERFPHFALELLEALGDAPDPEQAARYLRSFFARFVTPEPYVEALAQDPRALKRLLTALGSSVFIGDAILAHPELADVVVFGEGAISDPGLAVDAEIEVHAQGLARDADARERTEALVGALRVAKQRVMLEVAVADLAGSVGTREATRTLSALAEVELSRAVSHVLGDGASGLAVLSLGKLGGGELGYGSDLDVLFVFDPARAPDPLEAPAFFTERAQRVIRLISEPHAAGRGYELDTRLRPSGSQGMLVTSLESFARYHGLSLSGESPPSRGPSVQSGGAPWERQALTRIRFSAGDAALGARAVSVAERAAYEGRPPEAAEIHRMRLRMQRELGHEREGRYDLKLGRGGLLDVEFAAQYLQMRHGEDPSVRTPDTALALDALVRGGYLAHHPYEALREGYRFLRRLEQRIHVLGGTGSSVIEASGLAIRGLSARMGYRDGPDRPAVDALLSRYRGVTASVRDAYLEVLQVSEP